MLSAETASGRYPREAVAMMVRIAGDVEADPLLREHVFQLLPVDCGYPSLPRRSVRPLPRGSGRGAAAILAFTQTGSTAGLVAKYRPRCRCTRSPVAAGPSADGTSCRGALDPGRHRGDTETQIRAVEAAVLAAGVLKKGEVVVITMGVRSPTPAPQPAQDPPAWHRPYSSALNRPLLVADKGSREWLTKP